MCNPGPKGWLGGTTVWEELGRVDGRQSGHRSGCEAYQVWGAAGLADTRGEVRLSFLSLLWALQTSGVSSPDTEDGA